MNRTTRTAVFTLAALALAGCASFDPPIQSRERPCEFTNISNAEDLAWAKAVTATFFTPEMEAAIAAAHPGEPRSRP